MKLINLRAVRQACGLSVQELAEVSGYTPEHVYGLETCKHNASKACARFLAHLLNTTVEELMAEPVKEPAA